MYFLPGAMFDISMATVILNAQEIGAKKIDDAKSFGGASALHLLMVQKVLFQRLGRTFVNI